MYCCICAGWCMHIGPHIYCPIHQPNKSQLTYIPTFSQPTMLRPCDHCYCKPAIEASKKDHLKCCNCGNEQMKANLRKEGILK